MTKQVHTFTTRNPRFLTGLTIQLPLHAVDWLSMIEINTPKAICSVMFAKDGQHVLSAGSEAKVRRWRVDNGSEASEPIKISRTQIYAAALSPDGKWLVCGLYNNNDANVRVWDAQTHKEILRIKGHATAVYSVDISPDSTKFATGGYDRSAVIWSMTTGQRLVERLRHDVPVVAVRFSPDGDFIATVALENNLGPNIRIWDSKNGQRLLRIPFQITVRTPSPLAWSNDGRQLYTASNNEVSHFDASSGTLLSKWSIPGSGDPVSILLSRNQKFAVIAASKTLSFWDTATYTQIGTVIEHQGIIRSFSVSPRGDCIATGENNGKITIRSLLDILPDLYFDGSSNVVPGQESLTSSGYFTPFVASMLPFLQINYMACKSWWQGDLTCAEELLTEEILRPSDTDKQAHALASRSLVRTRSGNRDMAIDDAKVSIGTQRSVIGYIAHAMARLRNGEHDYALCAFDHVFSGGEGLASENSLLLLIRAIILFESEKRTDAISRVDDLIDIVDDQSVYTTVRAQMHLLLAGVVLRDGDHLRATELLRQAREAHPPQESPHLILISLIFGWDFDELAPTIEQHIQKCIKAHEEIGNIAMKSENMEDANVQYSAALSLGPSNRAAILIKRSKARGMLELWEEAMTDAGEAIQADPLNPWGYERRHAALHALRRFGEAVDAFTCMLSIIQDSHDQDIRQLGKKYVSRSQSENRIDNVIRGVFKICPLVLIDVQSGHLCDAPERMRIFKSESEFKELISSMTEALDDALILRVVAKYFQYVTFSHVWQGKEPSFQDVNAVQSVWKLDSSPLNEKLKGFCEVVRTDGYRWAWSDTCCIDKTISTVLNQSLTMMYKWYESSAATLVLLTTADSPSVLGALTDSLWMTRAWTAQELLAARVVRFYDRSWKLYLGDTHANHKESPEIMHELAKAIGISENTIAAFNPDDLSVREKLRVASKRNATVEEDVAYSLIGIFKSDIRPHYGEGDAALGHLLEEIVARSGEVTVLDWIGRSSSYNSCLPATLAVYSRPPSSLPAIDDAEMDTRVEALKNSLSQPDAILIHDRITRLPPARFANRRLYLPCIVFPVRRLGVQDMGGIHGCRYRARVSGIGYVEIRTLDQLPLTEPRRLILAHPWIRDLRDPFVGFGWRSREYHDDESGSDPETDAGSSASSPLQAVPNTAIDGYTRALRLIVRLQQSFHALLLQEQANGEFRRVAAEQEIFVPGIERKINLARDIRAEVVEIL